ncbi:helix-turn-helix domain-containing protein [Rhizorhabdus argentea]|uniref:helix-turn-helix domain-containing protein n=1 Tax=Rhizorhabdus argentea TaxID=1387174 RepID=UPI0030ECC956
MGESADERGLFPHNVGEQLAAERLRQKLELSDVAARTRIPLRHLEAIESGDHGGLPAIPYSAGFVKSYATMLGLDGQALSRAFRDEIGDARRGYFEPEAYEPVDPSRVPSRLLAMIALGVALLLGMGYLLLRFEGDNSDLAKLAADTVPDTRPVVPRPVAPPPASLPVEPAAPTGPISIAAADDVWLKISERDGSRTYYMDVMKAGQSFTVPDTAIDPILRTGRPQSVRVLIGATALPPVGEPDRLVRDYSLKRDALVAIATAQPALPGDNSAAASNAALPTPAAPISSDPPRRLVRPAPPGDDPAGSRPDQARPITDSNQRP